MTGCFAGFRIDGRRKMISKSLVEGLLFLEKFSVSRPVYKRFNSFPLILPWCRKPSWWNVSQQLVVPGAKHGTSSHQAHPRQVEVEAVASLFTAYSETVPWMTVGRSATTAFSPDGPLQS
ncbi:transport inhibitor response 1-like protein [Musa troglodytarum]|uniref:Transport inhibitor response 1-like protein n=1 Tax=Musa troglodytarum TaxID=320322 RepID=A0A9E7GM78_9LILI|nr:transport inhibitor response 1-like protein [Musa troglodytarum]